jgi:hypothetical protein
MSRYLSAKDVLKEIYLDEESGVVSEGEEEDCLEVKSEFDDESNEEEEEIFDQSNKSESIPSSESHMSFSNIDVTQPATSSKLNSIEIKNESFPSSESHMSFSNIDVTQPASKSFCISKSNKSESIPTSKFFKPIASPELTKTKTISNIPTQVSTFIRNKIQRTSFKKNSLAHKSFKQKNSSINTKKKIEQNKPKELIKDTSKWYGKETKSMIEKNISPYCWDKDPQLESFIPLRKYDLEPKFASVVNDCENLSDFFNFLINDQMIEIIVSSTNTKLATFSKDKNYLHKLILEPVNSIEIRAFIGLLLLFGVLKKNDVEIQEIWSEESYENIHSCYFATAAMSRNRFNTISSCVSFDEIVTREQRKVNDPKFYKMRSYFEQFRKNIRVAYEPGYLLCVDETL